jgi:hypothetical protein
MTTGTDKWIHIIASLSGWAHLIIALHEGQWSLAFMSLAVGCYALALACRAERRAGQAGYRVEGGNK